MTKCWVRLFSFQVYQGFELAHYNTLYLTNINSIQNGKAITQKRLREPTEIDMRLCALQKQVQQLEVDCGNEKLKQEFDNIHILYFLNTYFHSIFDTKIYFYDILYIE